MVAGWKGQSAIAWSSLSEGQAQVLIQFPNSQADQGQQMVKIKIDSMKRMTTAFEIDIIAPEQSHMLCFSQFSIRV